MEFVHLSVHTEFSLEDSVVRIKPLAAAAAQTMPAIAVSDRANLFALVKFYKAAIGAGIKPICGVDVLIANKELKYEARAILLVQNNTGYKSLTKLVSKSYQEGQATGTPLLQPEWLADQNDGLIMLSGGIDGDVGQAYRVGKPALAASFASQWQKLLGDRYYLELTRTGKAFEETYIQHACGLAAKLDIPVVATNDVRFLEKSEHAAHDSRICIQGGYVLADPKRPKDVSDQQYLKTPEEMHALFSDIPTAIQNAVEIAKRCNLELSLGKPVLPEFPIPKGYTETEYFFELSRQGLEARLDQLYDRSAKNFAEIREPYDARLERELGVISQMEFPGYFLIVADFIKWSRDNDIPVGPGRGSGAGSLVAYALNITDIDPLEYDLLFERFLNPERVSMPDFDIDFCMDGRDRVIQYVAEKYGSHRVSQIITYGTMAAKAVVRDVGRIMSHPYGFVDRVAKMVPFEVGMTLTKALEESEDLGKAYREDEEVTSLLDMALALEGLSRNCGKHAGGVVIASTALTDFSPLYCEPDGSSLVTQFDKDDSEDVGLVKFDFLGLRTLTIIDNAVKEINRHSDEPLDLSKLPLDDKATYDLLQNAQTTAVFQLESSGMKRLIERLQPDNFEDIIALVALYRPGPLQSGMVDDFIDRKHGRKKISFPHEDYQLDILKPVLEPTYGVILYQEQVIQIAQVMGGFSLGAADILRRAMGKKKAEEMAKQRAGFLQGCSDNGIDADLAGNIFDLVEKFAGYGFNKSHSAAYALLSYQTAWLKAHHGAAFMSSVLSSDMDNTEKVVIFKEECDEMGLTMLSPDINRSQVRFSVVDDKTILYGLGAIKGVGEAALANVLADRDANGPFADLDDLCRRADKGSVNKRVLEALIRSGAADALGPNRASLMAHIPDALHGADQYHRNQAAGQNDMFGLDEAAPAEVVQRTELPAWSNKERLKAEKETLGLYLSGHPIEEYSDELAKFTKGSLAALCKLSAASAPSGGQNNYRQKGKPVVAAGLVIAVRYRDFPRGKMCFVTIDDRTERVEITLRSDLIDSHAHLIQKDEVLVVEGEISPDDFNGGHKVMAAEIHDMAGARARFARRLMITLNSGQMDQKALSELLKTLTEHNRGSTPVFFNYENQQASARIQAGRQYAVNPQQELITTLSQLAGENSVEVVY